MSNISYSIEARAYDIVGLAAHDFWVLRDEQGRVLGQLHGLATNPDHEILPIGKFGDRLKFYHFGPRSVLFGLDKDRDRNYLKAGQQSRPVYTASPEEVLARWDHGVKLLPYLNDLDLPYTPFAIIGFTHINSNSAYALLGKLMVIPAPVFPRYWQPGWRSADRILNAQQLEAMRYSKTHSNVGFV